MIYMEQYLKFSIEHRTATQSHFAQKPFHPGFWKHRTGLRTKNWAAVKANREESKTPKRSGDEEKGE